MAGKEKLDVREACLEEALRMISLSGVESLSLREVARRLGLSHQAPYKHFPSRDHILAEVISREYGHFNDYLESSIRDLSPELALAAIGRAYLEYGAHHPLQYRLMFGTPLPDLEQHPELKARSARTFEILRDAISALRAGATPEELTLEGLFAWSTVHGLASIMGTKSFALLGIGGETQLDEAVRHVINHICAAVIGPGRAS